MSWRWFINEPVATEYLIVVWHIKSADALKEHVCAEKVCKSLLE